MCASPLSSRVSLLYRMKVSELSLPLPGPSAVSPRHMVCSSPSIPWSGLAQLVAQMALEFCDLWTTVLGQLVSSLKATPPQCLPPSACQMQEQRGALPATQVHLICHSEFYFEDLQSLHTYCLMLWESSQPSCLPKNSHRKSMECRVFSCA